MIVHQGSAQVVEVADIFFERAVRCPHRHRVVVGSHHPAFGARAVVPREVDHEGIVSLRAFADHAQQPADLVIGVFEEGGINFLLACEQPLLLRRERVPGWQFRRTGREFGVGRNPAELFLLGEDVERTESEIEVASLVAADPTAIGELAASYFCENVSEGSSVVALAGISGLEADAELAEDDYRVVALQAELEGISAALASDCAAISYTAQEGDTFTNEDSIAYLSNALGSNVGGVFAPNGELALATIRAARAARLLSSIKILAAEVTPETLGAIESNRLAGIVSATPESLGQIGVETVLAVLGGEEVESTVSVQLALVTSESVLEFRGQDDDRGDN